MDHNWDVTFAFEAKLRADAPLTTMLSIKMFEELIKFEQWLYFDLKYYDVPGIPRGEFLFDEYPGQKLMYNSIPEYLTWYDMCYKEEEVLNITFWPSNQDVPTYCRRNPSLCGIETKVTNRCQTSINALDFVYDVGAQDYVLHKYRTD